MALSCLHLCVSAAPGCMVVACIADDAIAGLVLSVLLIPQAMAYALLAGLPPQAGLYAALAPPLLYLLFGTSPYVSVGPVALVSLIVGDAIAASGFAPMTAAMVIALEAGAMLVLVKLLRGSEVRLSQSVGQSVISRCA